MRLFRRDRLQGKHVFLTGGSKGIGLALARELVRRGCDVTVSARGQADLVGALQALNALATQLGLTPKLQALAADTSSSGDLARALAAAEAGAGPVDVLICCAGLAIPAVFAEQGLEDFQRQMEVNYMGTVRAIKCVLPSMLARRQGQLVLVASVAAVTAFSGYASYAAHQVGGARPGNALHNEVRENSGCFLAWGQNVWAQQLPAGSG